MQRLNNQVGWPQQQYMQQLVQRSVLLVGLLISVSLVGQSWAKDNQTAIYDSIRKYDSCVAQSTFSYSKFYPDSSPPKTIEQLKAICRHQNEAFKCIKEKTRGSPPIIRRGLLAYVQTRQRHHKKYCTNPESELSRRFVEDVKCNMEKRYEAHNRADEDLAQTLVEIGRRNYNDSSIELKYLCCTFLAVKRNHVVAIGKECAHTKDTIEELADSVIPQEITLICEDDEKLAKVCPKLDQIVIAKGATFKPKPGNSPAALGLYLFATLGEPQEGPLDL